MLELVKDGTVEIVDANDAWERHRRIVNLRNQAEQTFLSLGEELYWFEEEKQYQDLGYKTFETYLADPDVDISRNVAFQLKRVFRFFRLELKVLPVVLLPAGYSKLDVIQPHVNQNNVEEWIAKAATLSRSDLRKAIDEAFPPPPPPPLPEGKFRILYADPPWSYDNTGFEQSALSKYKTLTVDEICNYEDESGKKAKDLAGESSVLFLWATSPLLPEALKVMEAWGFKYKASRIWIKNRAPGIGWWVNTYHELLLIGAKGDNLHPKEPDNSLINAPVGRHSEKPHSVYTDIENNYDGPYVELFARNEREGWKSWGNEL